MRAVTKYPKYLKPSFLVQPSFHQGGRDIKDTTLKKKKKKKYYTRKKFSNSFSKYFKYLYWKARIEGQFLLISKFEGTIYYVSFSSSVNTTFLIGLLKLDKLKPVKYCKLPDTY